MRPNSFVALVALAVLCCVTARISPARADAGAVLVVGEAQAKDRATVASAVRSAARSGGWELVETPLADSEVTGIVACLKAPQLWQCLSPVAAGRGIQRLIVVHLEPERSPDGAAALALTEQVLLPGAAVTADKRPCQKCIEETLTRIAFDLTKALLEEAASGTGRTRLSITSKPPGAWITLDNTNVGLTDRTYSTFPGRHVVIVQREGYEIEARNVDVVEDQQTTVAVMLHPKGGIPPSAGATERPYLVPGIVAGAGVAALATGIGLQLAKAPPDVGQHQPAYLVSVPGVALIVSGGVAVGLGAYLWMHATNQAAPPSIPTAAIVEGGGIVGWTGHI
jgi:hypothetical protein